MAERRAFGNMTSAPRFLAFLVILIIAAPVASMLLHGRYLGFMAGFDVASVAFLLACIPLLSTREAAVIRDHAIANDANKTLLLFIAGIVMAVLFASISAGTVGHRPPPPPQNPGILAPLLAGLFSNTTHSIPFAPPPFV